MSISFNSIGQNSTQKNYMDFLRPAAMASSSVVFKKLQIAQGTTQADALNIGSLVGEQILSTKGSELETLWTKIENGVNRRKTLTVNTDKPVGQLVTALGVMYNSMEELDKGDSISRVRSLNNIYAGVRNHIQSRFLGRQEGIDRRTLQRALDTMDSYFGRVVDRFNTRVQNNEIAGPEIPT